MIEIGLLALFRRTATVPTGPFGLIYALLVLYHFEVPAVSSQRLFGSVVVTEKWIIYAVAVQLALLIATAGWAGVAGGLLAGLLYYSDALPLQRSGPQQVSALAMRYRAAVSRLGCVANCCYVWCVQVSRSGASLRPSICTAYAEPR